MVGGAVVILVGLPFAFPLLAPHRAQSSAHAPATPAIAETAEAERGSEVLTQLAPQDDPRHQHATEMPGVADVAAPERNLEQKTAAE